MNHAVNFVLAFTALSLPVTALAGTKCNATGCKAAEAVCIATFDLDPVSCGVWYGCCQGSISINAPNSCSPITDASCSGGNPAAVSWPDDPSSTFGATIPALSYSGLPSIEVGAGSYVSAAANGTLVVEAAVDRKQRIFYNWWIQGGTAKGWKEFDGNGRAVSSPAVTLMQTALYAVVRQADGYLYMNQGALAGKFTGWQRLSFQSKYAPAVSSSLNTGVIVATNTQGQVFYSYWTRGNSSTPFVLVPGSVQTDAAPAAALVGSYLFIVIKGVDGSVYLNQGALGKAFVGWKSMGITTNVAPSATSSDTDAIVTVKDPQGHIYYNWWSIGEGGQGWTPLGGTAQTSTTPGAALTTKGYVFVSVVGPGGKLYLDQGDIGKTFVGWRAQ